MKIIMTFSRQYWTLHLLTLAFITSTEVLAVETSESIAKVETNILEGVVESYFDQLPDELIEMILRQGNFNINELFRVSKVDERFEAITPRLIAQKQIELETRYRSTRNLYPTLFIADFEALIEGLGEDINTFDRLESVSGSKIQQLLTRRIAIRTFLLDRLHEQNLMTLRSLIQTKRETDRTNFNPNKAYLAAFLAKYSVNLSAASKVVESAAKDPAWDNEKHNAWISTSKTASTAPLFAIENAVQDAARYSSRNDVWDNTSDQAWISIWENTESAAMDVVPKATKKALLEIVPFFPSIAELGEKAYYLSEIITLHWLEQNGSEHLKMAFNEAYQALDQLVTIQQTKEMLDRQLNSKELSGNPYGLELKAFLLEIEKLVFLNESNLELGT